MAEFILQTIRSSRRRFPARRIRSLTGLLAVLSLVLIAACAVPRAPPPADMTFFVVRHAEKADDDARDPSLSETGRLHAEILAQRLARAPLRAVYATDFRRTRQTAQPAAASQDLPVTTYDATEPPTDFADRLRRTYERGAVLVVGHSNTVPPIVAALCGCAVENIGDAEYGRLYRVVIDQRGAVSVERDQF